MSTEIHSSFVGAEAAARLLNISRSGFLKFVKNGVLPEPNKLGGRRIWFVEDLIAAAKAAGSCPDLSSHAAREGRGGKL